MKKTIPSVLVVVTVVVVVVIVLVVGGFDRLKVGGKVGNLVEVDVSAERDRGK